MRDDINVRLIDFRITSSYEMVRRNEDESITILLNSRQATNQLREAYREAIRHIERGDIDSHGDVQTIETNVHEETP